MESHSLIRESSFMAWYTKTTKISFSNVLVVQVPADQALVYVAGHESDAKIGPEEKLLFRVKVIRGR